MSRSRVSRRCTTAFVTAVTSSALVLVGAGGASAHGGRPRGLPPGGSAVATLGDSYASGEGAPAPGAQPWTTNAFGDSGSDGCHRSALGGHAVFGESLAGHRGRGYVNAACSGATTATLVSGSKGERSQLDALGPRTRTVTLSIGGNDAGFSTVATACNTVQPVPGAPSCENALAGSAAALRALTSAPAGGVSPLEQLYRTVQARAPHARLVVTGYPLLFPTGTASARCDVIAPQARTLVNQATLQLNAAAASTAAAVGATYVDLVRPFTGHSSCDADPGAWWINSIVPQDPVLSFHPNAVGQRAITASLEAVRCSLRPRH